MCAVKILKELTEDDAQMIKAEVELMAKVDSPHVLKQIDYGKADIVKPKTGKVKDTVFYIALKLAKKMTMFDFIT